MNLCVFNLAPSSETVSVARGEISWLLVSKLASLSSSLLWVLFFLSPTPFLSTASILSATLTPSPEVSLYNILPPQLKEANGLLTYDRALLIDYELKVGRKRATLIIPSIEAPPKAFCARRVNGTANSF